MSEQKTAQRNWHSIVGPNGMCECGVDAAGVVTTCGRLHQAELGVSPGDLSALRARIEQLRGQKPEPSVIPSSPYMDGWDAALDVVLRLLDGSKDAGKPNAPRGTSVSLIRIFGSRLRPKVSIGAIMNLNIVGTCSECGGPVSTPAYMINPVPRCANCGATMANPYGPKIPMEPRRKPVSPGKE